MAKKITELPNLPRGMGSYNWKNDEHTKIRYRKQITHNGKSFKLSVDGDTIAECNALMKEREDAIKKEIIITSRNEKSQTLEQGMLNWLQLYKSQEVFSRSYDRIESMYLTHISGTDLGQTQEQTITSDDIQKHINDAKNSKTKEPLSYSSKKKLYELLDQYFKYKYIKQPQLNPMIPVVKPKKTEKETLNEELVIWTDDEMKALCDAATQPYINGISGFKHGMGIIFIMWTFIRIGEALALTWEDIDLENETIKISKSYSRTKIREGAKAGQYQYNVVPTKGKKTRQFKMCKMAVDSIKEYKKRRNPSSDKEYIFSTGKDNKILTETSITRMYDGMKIKAGLDDSKHVTIHGLRHTGISYFLRHGVPVEVVSRMAGHQSVQITIDTYYQVLEEQKSQAVEDLNKYASMDIM